MIKVRYTLFRFFAWIGSLFLLIGYKISPSIAVGDGTMFKEVVPGMEESDEADWSDAAREDFKSYEEWCDFSYNCTDEKERELTREIAKAYLHQSANFNSYSAYLRTLKD